MSQYRRSPKALPCDVCRRVHPARCEPEDQRSVRVCVSLPAWLARELDAAVPWGDRSGWIARLVERELTQ